MKGLGKIFIILVLFTHSLYAGIVADVDGTHVSEGDVVTFSLNLSGEKIQKPEITSLCGEDIISTGSSTSIQSINGNYSKTYVLTYRFVATKSCRIEPISLSINGNIETSKPIDIVVSKFQPSAQDDFYLTLESDKKSVYIGEPFKVTLTLKQKRSARVVDSKFEAPTFSGFWVKGTPIEKSSQDDSHIITQVIYTLAGQREGTLNIDPAKISIATRVKRNNYWGGMFQDVRWKNYFSNALDMQVKPLPGNSKLIGNFKIETFVDKKEVNANEAVNVTLKVSGTGNLEDVTTFKPYVDGVSVFDEDIVLQGDSLTQKITFVADNSFEIPSFILEFFNPTTNLQEKVFTNPIPITVKNAKAKEELKVKKDEVPVVSKEIIVKEVDSRTLILAFIAGISLGVIIMYLVGKKFRFKKEKKIDLGDHKSLMVKLLPYADNEDVKEIIDIIEKNSYSEQKEKIDKKALKAIIKKYDLH